MRVGVLGGTFDPVHLGHLLIAEEARVRLKLDRVLLIPAGDPWLKSDQALTPSEHRLRMLELAAASNPFFQVARNEINRPGPSYTVDTLRELRQELGPETGLYFILGLDALEQFHRWEQPESILELCELAIVSRAGYQNSKILDQQLGRFPKLGRRVNLLSVPLVDISATDIRNRASKSFSFRYQVPESVEQYIHQHRLYLPGEDGTMSAVSKPVDRLLKLALEREALKYGEFTLSSGKKSSYYFDGRLLSLDPGGALLIGQALLPLLREAGVEAVGGPTLGADPIVAAVALTSQLEGKGIPAFIVRKDAKEHGTSQLIEGPLAPGCRVAIVDDTCTTGGSLLHGIAAAEAVGCTVVKVLVLLDRREGGTEELRRRGYDFSALMAANPQGKIEVVSEG